MKKNLLLASSFLLLQVMFAQTVPYSILFDDTKVNAIYITMEPDSLEEMYDELENEYEYAVQFVYTYDGNSDTLQDVGFRLRGNTSLGSAKKSFKVSFNTYNAGRTYQGAKKLNLIGNHNDPTMAREKIYFDIYNSLGLPTRRVSFVDVYINGQFFGLYTLTEEYDDIFLRDRYGDDSGALFKCLYGSTMTYNGENLNAYNTYEQQNNEQVNMKGLLVELTDVLNNTPISELPCELEKVFDIEQFLKIYALDISCGHWDNYGANQNNYFLYHDPISGQFKFLSYDCDNVLGIDWFGIDWGTRNVYNWNFDGRPMVERLMQVPEYRDRLTFYLEQIATIAMDTAYWFPRLDAIRDLIAPSALLDIYRTMDYGYSYADFLDGFDTDDIDGHCPYGIKNFFTQRNSSTLDQIEIVDVAPIVHYPIQTPYLMITDGSAHINVLVEDESASTVTLSYAFDGGTFIDITLFDDGAHGDGFAGDALYGNSFSVTGNDQIAYHVTAVDAVGQETVYPSCDHVVRAINYTAPLIVINEVMADNQSTVPDNTGEFPDYIELYNPGTYSVYLGDKFITDEASRPTKWRLPDQQLPPDTYLLLYADNETGQGSNHASFTLDADNDQVYIFGDVLTGYGLIDSVSFSGLATDSSIGRLPNGTGPFVILPVASPGAFNADITTIDPTLFTTELTNNPGNISSELIITMGESTLIGIDVYAMSGQKIYATPPVSLSAGTHIWSIPAADMMSGSYLIRIRHGDDNTVIPYIVY